MLHVTSPPLHPPPWEQLVSLRQLYYARGWQLAELLLYPLCRVTSDDDCLLHKETMLMMAMILLVLRGWLADHRTWPGHQHQCARIEMANSRVSFYLWPCPHVLLSSSESHPYTCQADRALCANSIITPSALSMKANVSLLQSLLSNHCTHHLTWGGGKAGRAAPTPLASLLPFLFLLLDYYLSKNNIIIIINIVRYMAIINIINENIIRYICWRTSSQRLLIIYSSKDFGGRHACPELFTDISIRGYNYY